jgi:hypothetical protein
VLAYIDNGLVHHSDQNAAVAHTVPSNCCHCTNRGNLELVGGDTLASLEGVLPFFFFGGLVAY